MWVSDSRYLFSTGLYTCTSPDFSPAVEYPAPGSSHKSWHSCGTVDNRRIFHSAPRCSCGMVVAFVSSGAGIVSPPLLGADVPVCIHRRGHRFRDRSRGPAVITPRGRKNFICTIASSLPAVGWAGRRRWCFILLNSKLGCTSKLRCTSADNVVKRWISPGNSQSGRERQPASC